MVTGILLKYLVSVCSKCMRNEPFVHGKHMQTLFTVKYKCHHYLYFPYVYNGSIDMETLQDSKKNFMTFFICLQRTQCTNQLSFWFVGALSICFHAVFTFYSYLAHTTLKGICVVIIHLFSFFFHDYFHFTIAHLSGLDM